MTQTRNHSPPIQPRSQPDWTGAGPDTAAVWQGADLQRARQKYLRDWSIVKRVRFKAAKRLERKHAASQIAFAFAAVLTMVIPQSTHYFGANMAPHTRNVIEYYTYVASSLALVFGLIEQARGYDAIARQFHDCGRQVNAILRRLRSRPLLTDAELQGFIAEYERALDACQHNHDPIDFEQAVLEEEAKRLQGELRDVNGVGGEPLQIVQDAIAVNATKRAALDRRGTWRTYRLYLVLLGSPIIFATFAFFALGPK